MMTQQNRSSKESGTEDLANNKEYYKLNNLFESRDERLLNY